MLITKQKIHSTLMVNLVLVFQSSCETMWKQCYCCVYFTKTQLWKGKQYCIQGHGLLWCDISDQFCNYYVHLFPFHIISCASHTKSDGLHIHEYTINDIYNSRNRAELVKWRQAAIKCLLDSGTPYRTRQTRDVKSALLSFYLFICQGTIFSKTKKVGMANTLHNQQSTKKMCIFLFSIFCLTGQGVPI